MIEYKDLRMRIVLSLVAAVTIVFFNADKQLRSGMPVIAYVNALLASFIIAFLLLYVIWLVTRYLDKKYYWLEQPRKRTVAQVFYGIVTPGIFGVLMAAVYFRMYGLDIRNTTYFTSDFPLIILLLVMGNTYYFCYFMVATFWPRKKWIPVVPVEIAAAGVFHEPPLTLFAEDEVPDPYTSVVPPAPSEPVENNPEEAGELPRHYKKIILVKTPLETIPVEVTMICYFFRRGNNNYLRTWSGEDYSIEYSLDDIENLVSPVDFFRNNRKMIISFKSCQGFGKTVNGKMEISLSVPYTEEPVTVSYGKQVKFKQWMER